MDIFTDASLNAEQKIAGVGMVFVPNPGVSEGVLRFHNYVWADKIETAELFAIAMALNKLDPKNTDKIRIVTDSDKAITEIMYVFQYRRDTNIKNVKDLVQQKILRNIAASFEKLKNASFSFHLVKAHQSRAPAFSDGAYNRMADEEADIGRQDGEDARLTEMLSGNKNRVPTAEENAILSQHQSAIFFPDSLSFSFETQKTKKTPCRKSEGKGFTKKRVHRSQYGSR